MLFSPSKKLQNIHNYLVLDKKGMETCLGHWSFLVQEKLNADPLWGTVTKTTSSLSLDL